MGLNRAKTTCKDEQKSVFQQQEIFMFLTRWIFPFLILFFHMNIVFANQNFLVSTESDPDAFIQDCVNVINGDYCEVATDLVIPGPDAFGCYNVFIVQMADGKFILVVSSYWQGYFW